jgi:hypothetical protein
VFVGSIATCEKIKAEEVFLELGLTPGVQSLNKWQRLLEEFQPAKAAAS